MNQSSPSITNTTVEMETNIQKMDVMKKKVSTVVGNLFSKEGSKNQFVPRRKTHGNYLYWGVLFLRHNSINFKQWRSPFSWIPVFMKHPSLQDCSTQWLIIMLAKEQWTIVYNTIPHSRKQEEEKYQQQRELVQFLFMVTLAAMEPIHKLIQAGHLGNLITKCVPDITTRSTLYPIPSSP